MQVYLYMSSIVYFKSMLTFYYPARVYSCIKYQNDYVHKWIEGLGSAIKPHKKYNKFMSKIHNPDNQPFMINARTRLVDTLVERASQHAPLNMLSPTF